MCSKTQGNPCVVRDAGRQETCVPKACGPEGGAEKEQRLARVPAGADVSPSRLRPLRWKDRAGSLT